MARENNYLAIVLKKQPYGEGDEILTLFTKEAGKIRGLAKSTKMPKSKLRYGLQALFVSKITTTKASSFPKIIRADAVKTFAHLQENLDAVKEAYYALELLIKFTADEQKNERLFDLAVDFFDFLDNKNISPQNLHLSLAKFKLEFLESIGLGIHLDMPQNYQGPVGFSNARGGFLFSDKAVDYFEVPLDAFHLFLTLKTTPFNQISSDGTSHDGIQRLQDLLSGFIRYQLEREIKSERFLDENVV